MPVDYQQVYVRIKEIGAGARERSKTLEERRSRARGLLAAYAGERDVLRAKVDSAKAIDANIRCALPVNESLTAHYAPVTPAKGATLIAADGSQINPDRHAAVQYCLVNVAAILMKLDSGDAPRIFIPRELMYGY